MTDPLQQQLFGCLEHQWQDAAAGMERLKGLLALGAELNPPSHVPPIFFALRALNAPAVEVLMAAGARLDLPLSVDWVEYDDEGESVIARAGTTARQFYVKFDREERADGARYGMPKAREQWLNQMSALLGADAEPATEKGATKKGATKKGTKKAATKKAATKKSPTTAAEPAGLDGRWREVERRSLDEEGGRRSRLSRPGLLVIEGERFTQEEGTGLGLPRKGKLTVQSGRHLYVDEDLRWPFVLLHDRLVVTSPAEADEEHGIVQESTFEREPKKKR